MYFFQITKNIGKFNIKDLKNGTYLGKGGFGTVYKYLDNESQQTFAVKMVLFNSDQNSEIQSLEKEISIYTKLKSHIKIVTYFGNIKDTDNTNNTNSMYIFMEYMNGGSIKTFLKTNGSLTSPMISWYSKQILEGLAYLHENKIIHRDIKCDNILRDDKENIKLCDFGVSKILESISSCRSKAMANTVCGTGYFMAPEVVNGEDYSVWADVWSLGATVVEMLTGDHPYPKLNDIQAMCKVLNTKTIEYEPPQPISAVFKAFIDRMLTGDPKDRATVKELQKSEFILNTPKTVEEIIEKFVKK